MIDKLEPREMLYVSQVAKKLHEVIDYLNKIEEDVNNESEHDNTISGQGNGEDNTKRDSQENENNNLSGDKQASDMGDLESKQPQNRIDEDGKGE